MRRLEYEDWEQKWNDLYEKLEREGYKNLTPDERLWFNVRSVIDAINSGGISSYYVNKWFENMDDTFEDLEKLNANNVIELLKHVNEKLPTGTLLKDGDEISDIFADLDEQNDDFNDFIEELNDKFADEIEEELELKLDQVVMQLLK
ncbi:DUF4375 domain-containing protein [Neobacillus sp. PS3-34]|uniref:DMP19 family protein n=1 Tax=Neobacillus sp. PS3-34 TaxID=3070678 RepID=UPI0027DF076D|nr:DUF4375 domain-containing protein [Neobacillus sp. PS3-34]WML48798.1 DUF4375 domain-containing protein [Neobacillus sp. PS3-34]